VERFRAASFLSPFQEIRKASSELRWVGDHAVVAGMFSCGGFSETVMQSKHGKARSRSRNMHLVVRWWQTRRTNQRNLSLSACCFTILNSLPSTLAANTYDKERTVFFTSSRRKQNKQSAVHMLCRAHREHPSSSPHKKGMYRRHCDSPHPTFCTLLHEHIIISFITGRIGCCP
jgi:hypothetical protein